MSSKKPIVIRMCVQCRERLAQNTLLRLQSFEHNISPFTGVGRSFYVCKNCASQESFTQHMLGKHKISKHMKETFREQLKEIVANG